MIASATSPAATRISEAHIAELAASGVGPEAAAAAGIWTEADPARVAELLRWRGPADELGPCLVYPYLSLTGAPTGYHRLKPTSPRMLGRGDREPRAAKYEAPVGEPHRPYLPPGTRGVIPDPQIPLVITEGEKKALAADAAGIPAIGVPGVWAWQRRRERDACGRPVGERELLPELAAIPWRDRTVTIAFDSDWRSKQQVYYATTELARALSSLGARVRIADIPPGEGGVKQGVDDYIVAHGREALMTLLESAAPASDIVAATQTPIRSIADPHDLADGFLNYVSGGDTTPHLRYWQGTFWRYRDRCYQQVPDHDIRGELSAWLRAELDRRLAQLRQDAMPGQKIPAVNVTVSLVGNVMAALAGRCLLPASTEMPGWIDGATGPSPRDLIPLHNGLLDVTSGQLIPHTPRFFATTSVPYEYDQHATCPEWMRFLESIWPDDHETVSALQEWFGYLLTCDTKLQKILLLLGPRRSGKGTICRVLTALVGRDNVASPTLSSLATQFGLQPLVGRNVAIVPDARLGGRADASAIAERLLSISGEDAQTIDLKYREPITTRLTTRFVIATNELPRLGDASGALSGRFVILRFVRSFFGAEDHGLEGRLMQELPGILVWALEGLRRLRARGRFVPPASSRELAEELDDLASPMGAFVRERCVLDASAATEVSELYRAWRGWCDEHGRDHPGTQQSFGRDLRAAVPALSVRQRRQSGERWREYVGVRLRRADDPLDDTPPADRRPQPADGPVRTSEGAPRPADGAVRADEGTVAANEGIVGANEGTVRAAEVAPVTPASQSASAAQQPIARVYRTSPLAGVGRTGRWWADQPPPRERLAGESAAVAQRAPAVTAAAVLDRLIAAGCHPRVDGAALVLDQEPPEELAAAVEYLHTGVRAAITGKKWWGGEVGTGRTYALDPQQPIPWRTVYLSVAGDGSLWDQLAPEAHRDHPELFSD